MAKGLRSASKRRCRAARRQHVQQVVEKERLESIHHRLLLLQQGIDLTPSDITPLNAFLHPGMYGAIFPQHKPNNNPIDFRSENLGILAGLATSHNRRKYTAEEEEEFMKKYGHLPGKTEDPRTQQLRRRLNPGVSASAVGDETGDIIAEEEDEIKQPSDAQPYNVLSSEAGALTDKAAGSKKGGEKAAMETLTAESGTMALDSDAYSSQLPSMMLTPEMEEMMRQRRKTETAKIPVHVNKLKDKGHSKRSSIPKKKQKKNTTRR